MARTEHSYKAEPTQEGRRRDHGEYEYKEGDCKRCGIRPGSDSGVRIDDDGLCKECRGPQEEQPNDIIGEALEVAGQLWAAYKDVPDPSGQGELGDAETRKWADETSPPHRRKLAALAHEAIALVPESSEPLDDETVRIVCDVRALEIAILHYISRGGPKFGMQLVEAWGRIGHWMQRWGVPSRAKKTGEEIGLPVIA